MSYNIRFISAGAGSGKTYTLTRILEQKLAEGSIRPDAVMATTFTRKAAAELLERVRGHLIRAGRGRDAILIQQSRIGTVNALCGGLLREFAFMAGLSPQIRVLEEREAAALFDCALDQVADSSRIAALEAIAHRLGLDGWNNTVREIVDKARINRIDTATLRTQAIANHQAFLGFFPTPAQTDLTQDLRQEVEVALKACRALIAQGIDTTGVTAGYADQLESIAHILDTGDLPWSQWVKLAKSSPGAKARTHAQPVKAVAEQYAAHPRLHGDIKTYLETLFALAADAAQAYQAIKAERGLMDFSDQEQQVLDLLEQEAVRDILAERLDLLLVDEFQDTSPIQLAIFLKLAGIAGETIWVGDIKQAIYGFRNSDPALMTSILDKLRAMACPVRVLDRSWRSVPDLVALVNALFVPAFAPLAPAAEVRLEPTRAPIADTVALEFWWLAETNQAQCALALAAGIRDLLREPPLILDPATGQTRAAAAGDIAVLCRLNGHAAEIAAALRGAGLDASLSEAGLLATPEVGYALACLRYLAYPNDTLATAEIIALHSGLPSEQWLEDRLDYLAAGGVSRDWGTAGKLKSPVLERLRAERVHLGVWSPTEALDRALLLGEVEDAVAAWGPTPARALQRQAHLEALRGFARAYEDECGTVRVPATLSGWLIWLDRLREEGEDLKPPLLGGQAVQVLTYHKAKGLEWPVVVCSDLESKPRSRLWQLQVVDDGAPLDIEHPLAGRRIHYWPWPFAQQSAGIPVADAIAASPEGWRQQTRELAESLRLLYVGLTRARDILILALKPRRPAAWLDSLNAPWLKPGGEGCLTLPGGGALNCRERVLHAGPANAGAPPTAQFPWLPAFQPFTPKSPATVRPHQFPPLSTAHLGKVHTLGAGVAVKGVNSENADSVGTALHGVFAAYFTDPGYGDHPALAAALIDRHGLKGIIPAPEAVQAAIDLRELLIRDYQATAFLPEWPVQVTQADGSLLTGWIDLLVETPEGCMVIDHKSQGGGVNGTDLALQHSGQLDAYRSALVACGRKVRAMAVHLALGGILAVVET